MASQNYKDCETRLIQHEGTRYTDGVNPYDPGGPTRYGITLADARLHWKSNATADDVRTMPIAIALAIYKSKYWDAVSADALPSGLDYSTFDYGVNSGIGRAGKVLRRLCSLPDNTSKINKDVLDAVAKRDTKVLIKAMNDERLKFLQTLKIWPTYKGGWTTRVREVLAYSLVLASAVVTGPAANKSAPLAVPTQVVPTGPAVDEVMAKGMIPPPTGAKNAVKTVGTAAPVAGGYGLWDWVCAHPAMSVMLVVCVIVCVVGGLKLLTANHAAKQEAPTPGLVPVPELAAA